MRALIDRDLCFLHMLSEDARNRLLVILGFETTELRNRVTANEKEIKRLDATARHTSAPTPETA